MTTRIKGFTLRQIPEGKPGAGIKIGRLHYSYDESMTPERVAKLKSEYSNPWIAEREMEINPYAMGGKRNFPGYSDEVHLVDQRELGGSGAEWTTYFACDPHPELAHAFVDLAFWAVLRPLRQSAPREEHVVANESGQQY